MMFTGPRAMNSYPYQTNHMPSTHYYHPNWEPAPMQARENPTGPLMHGPWPRYSGCQVPMACPNCSNHGHCPHPYYISPHCQQYPSPPPHFYGGYYPPYPQPCHVGYVPPSHYSMELPRYEYDNKVLSGFHCCECPNHQHNLKEEKGVKIEEHEPDVETKKSESLIPSGASNFSYPLLWIPSEYGANKQNFRSVDKEIDDRHGGQVFPYVTGPQCVQEKKCQGFPTVVQHQQDSQPVEQDSARCGWFPLDMDSLRKLIESGVEAKACGEEKRNVDERTRNDVEIKNQHKQFPYNIIWLPYDGQGEKKERIASTEPVEKASPISGDVPSKSDRPDSETEKMKTIPVQKLQECVPKLLVESKEQKEAKQSGGNFKTIPVKQLEEFVPKPTVESKELKGDKEAKGNANEECAQKGVQVSSPTKKSKLPPICLRVDPPKKKNGSGNGSLRSPSPGDKKRQSPDDLKSSGKSEAMQPSTKDIKVEAKDEKPSYNKIEVVHVPQNEKKESVLDKSADSKDKAVHKSNDENSDVTVGDGREARKPTKKSLSETESAIIIQSAYRGHEVRRTEPLKKLRQIVKIRDEVHEVRKRVEDLVSSVDNSIDKERVAIGETIMKLLLKLDTIQGLLPSIRDFRKCVANELTVLQEKLDSITCQNAAHQETRTVEEQAKHSCMDEGHKDDLEIRNESSSADSSQVEVSEVNSESANEFSKDSIQGEGSEYNAGISDESSKDSVQHESSRIAEHVSILNEGCHGADMNVNGTEGKLANSMNQVPPCPPPKTKDLVCDWENKENLEAVPVSISPVNVDSESGSLDEVNVGEKRPKVSEESGELQICLEYVADDPMPNGVTLGNEEEAEYLLAELPRDVLDYGETNKETPETEADMESMLRELPIQVIDDDDAKGETPGMTNIVTQDEEKSEKDAPEAALGVSPEDKEVDVDLLAELPHEQSGEVSSSEVLKHGSKVEQPSEKPEVRATESLARVDDEPQSVNSNIDTDVLIVEQDVDEGVRNEGLAMCEIVKQESFGKHSEFEHQQTKDEDETSELSSESQDLDAKTRNEKIERKMIEENERMKEMLDKMIAYGKQQQDLISSLSSKVEDLEKRLAKKKAAAKEAKSKRPRVKVLKSGNGLSKERAMGVAS